MNQAIQIRRQRPVEGLAEACGVIILKIDTTIKSGPKALGVKKNHQIIASSIHEMAT